MVWVIAIIAILGNLYLFSGYDVEGGLATFMVGVALCADAFLVYSIFKAIFSKNKASATPSVTSKPTTPVSSQGTIKTVELNKNATQYPTEKKVEPVVAQSIKGTSIKCPVCKTALSSSVSKCSSCGFTELHREFINADDAATWFENVVVPYRIEWEKKKSEPAFLTADELYAQMAAKQNKGISTHIDESASEFEVAGYLDGVEIIQYNGNSAHVTIPNKINGKPVLKLCNSLFENCKWITEVTLPNELTTIGNKVFRSTTLTHIVFPNSIKEIGEEAFSYSAVTEMVFPPSIKVLPKNVCYSCKKLKTVIIMGAVEIGEYAFSFCDAITRLALPETLVTIKNAAFSCCHALDNIVLPASLQSVYGDFSCSLRGSIVVLNNDLVWRPASKSNYLGSDITIYCNPGSTSQQHARDWGMKMKLLSEYQH